MRTPISDFLATMKKLPSCLSAITGNAVFDNRPQSLETTRALSSNSLARRNSSQKPAAWPASLCRNCARSAASPWRRKSRMKQSSAHERSAPSSCPLSTAPSPQLGYRHSAFGARPQMCQADASAFWRPVIVREPGRQSPGRNPNRLPHRWPSPRRAGSPARRASAVGGEA